MKAITYGQLRDVLDALLKSGARKASDPLYLNGQYWEEIIDCRAKVGKPVRGIQHREHKRLARGRVKVTPLPPERIKLV